MTAEASLAPERPGRGPEQRPRECWMRDDRQSGGNGERPAYQRPRLKVHGNLKKLTAVKRGTKNDGGGKPRTCVSGGAA
jgi:hypothetical protein